jgi:7-cyano-7-deazaguanine synthase
MDYPGFDMITIVLLSGGIDSMVAAHLVKSQNCVCDQAIFIDYAQPSVDAERVASRAIAAALGIKQWSSINVCGIPVPVSGFMQARNLMFSTLALSALGMNSGLVVTGIHDGTCYSDCTHDFHRLVQATYDLYTEGSVQFTAPLLSWKKADIVNYALHKQLPIGLTHSCESSGTSPCGTCASCKDRYELLGKI